MPCSSSLFGICIFCLFIFLALSYFEFIIRIPQIAKNDKCFRKNSKYFSVPTLCIFLKCDKNLRQHFPLLFLVSFFRRFPALFYKIFFILKKFRREKFETSPARCCFFRFQILLLQQLRNGLRNRFIDRLLFFSLRLCLRNRHCLRLFLLNGNPVSHRCAFISGSVHRF